ncbi:MAG: hypothetical protein AAB037_06415, partial [Chloroflexota bacterium]
MFCLICVSHAGGEAWADDIADVEKHFNKTIHSLQKEYGDRVGGTLFLERELEAALRGESKSDPAALIARVEAFKEQADKTNRLAIQDGQRMGDKVAQYEKDHRVGAVLGTPTEVKRGMDAMDQMYKFSQNQTQALVRLQELRRQLDAKVAAEGSKKNPESPAPTKPKEGDNSINQWGKARSEPEERCYASGRCACNGTQPGRTCWWKPEGEGEDGKRGEGKPGGEGEFRVDPGRKEKKDEAEIVAMQQAGFDMSIRGVAAKPVNDRSPGPPPGAARSGPSEEGPSSAPAGELIYSGGRAMTDKQMMSGRVALSGLGAGRGLMLDDFPPGEIEGLEPDSLKK